MSYILDALNKAERERGIKRAPASLLRHDLPAGPDNRSWIIAGVVIACAAAALWLFLPSLHKDSRSSSTASAGAEKEPVAGRTEIDRDRNSIQSNASPSLIPPSELLARTGSGLSNEALLSQGSMTRATAAAASASETVTSRQAGGMEVSAGAARRLNQAARAETLAEQNQLEPDEPPPAEESASQAQAFDDGQAAKAAPPAPHSVGSKALSLREAVDKMTISVLMYSEAKAERRAYINGRKYVEGDYVDGRYLVESITLEGVALSCEGERALLRSGPK